ncbi:MAG: hypothetical protein ACTSYR_05255 [Candidatus Odinarchaeia archaeon]
MSEEMNNSNVIPKLEELINLNVNLKSLFKDLIETVGERLQQVDIKIKSIEESLSKLTSIEDRINELESDIKTIKDAVSVGVPVKEVSEVAAEVAEQPSESVVVSEPESKRAGFQVPSRGPVDDIFRELVQILGSQMPGEELAKKFEEARDRLMEHHSFHPVYHEMARVINTLRKYKENKLTKRDIEELESQIDNWRDRMLS